MRYLILLLGLLGWMEAGQIRVAMAANVSYAMPALIRTFAREHPGITIETTVGGSGKLAAQIRNGAPYDLFLSANRTYPQKLYEDSMTIGRPVIYAQGALAYLSNTPRDFSRGIRVLGDPLIHSIAVANPKTAPYGKAAFEALEKAGLLPTLRPKLVFGESIAQTVAYATHAADIGLVAKSALFAPQMKRYKPGKNWADVDPALYRPIDQGMVLLKKAANPKEAKIFHDFLLSKSARAIFMRYGYRVP